MTHSQNTAKPEIAWIAFKDLKVDRDHDVQRTQNNPRKVARMAANFDMRLVGVLTVSERQDGYYVTDGSHRTEAALASGHGDMLVPCIMHRDLTYTDESRLFLGLNDSTKVGRVDTFRARARAEQTAAKAIVEIVEKHGWTIGNFNARGSLRAVAALERLYSYGSDEETSEWLVDATMSVITEAWELDTASANAHILGGVGLMLHRYSEIDVEVDLDRLATKLSQHRPVEVIAKGRLIQGAQGGSMAAGVAKAITGFYNTKLTSSRLPEWNWTR